MAGFDLRRFFARKSESAHASDQVDSTPTTGQHETGADIPVTGRRHLPPDPRIIQAIGKNHSFDSAVADIVDNSLDAGARKVLIRFVRDRDDVIGLYIADDGRGMNETLIDRAMTLGGQRTYNEGDLGHFGIGLKAASLGQARSLTVVSRASGSAAVGRRLLTDKLSEGFDCEILDAEFAASTVDRPWGHVSPTTGTIVIWNQVRPFQLLRSGAADAFLDDATNRLCRHLGLVFHRIIAANGVEIVIDQEDVGLGETGAPFSVKPIDPFGYSTSGRSDYPRVLTAVSDAGTLKMRCHVWPGRSNDAKFKLAGGSAEAFQGFFIYRNSRLLQPGGWHGAALRKPEYQLARIEIEMTGAPPGLFEMNPEKTHVEPTAAFTRMVHDAVDGDVNFDKYLEDASHAYRESRRRNRDRPKILQPGSGVAREVKSAFGDEYDFIPGREPMKIRWAAVEGDTFFEFDKEASLIRLNRRYRRMVAGEGHGGLNDAPLVKALIYLLSESVMRGEVLGSRDKDNISIWQAILTTAALTEEKRDRQRDETDTSMDPDSTTT